MPAFVCGVCSRAFGSEFNYQRHLLTSAHRRAQEIASAFGEGDGGKFVCHICNASFTRRDNHRRHVMSHEGGEERLCFRCGLCSSCFKNKDELTSHRRREHVRHHDFKLVESAHRRQCQLLRAYFPESAATVDEALVYAYSQLEKMLTSALVEVPFFKCFLTVFVEMGKYDEEGRLAALEVFPFRGFTMTLGRETELKSELRKTLGDVERNVDEFLFQGSGWVVERPVYMDVEISECRVLKGGAAGGGPTCGRHAAGYRRGRGAVPLNVSGEEEEEEDAGMCFYLAVASHFLPSTATAADLRRFVEREFVLPPERSRKEVTLEMARRFEADNARHEISINIVYRDETNAVVPVVASANPLAKNLVVLMLFHVRSGGEEGDRGVMHYALVDNPGRIFADRTENSWGRLQTRNVFICFNCFNAIRSEGAYREHIAFCHQRNCQRVCLPKRGEVLAFDESSIAGDRRTFLSAFLLFYDFEALQVDPAKRCSCPEEKVRGQIIPLKKDDSYFFPPPFCR